MQQPCQLCSGESQRSKGRTSRAVQTESIHGQAREKCQRRAAAPARPRPAPGHRPGPAPTSGRRAQLEPLPSHRRGAKLSQEITPHLPTLGEVGLSSSAVPHRRSFPPKFSPTWMWITLQILELQAGLPVLWRMPLVPPITYSQHPCHQPGPTLVYIKNRVFFFPLEISPPCGTVGHIPLRLSPELLPTQLGNQKQAQATSGSAKRGMQAQCRPGRAILPAAAGSRGCPRSRRVLSTGQPRAPPRTGRRHRPGLAGPRRGAAPLGMLCARGKEPWNILQELRSCISARPGDWQSRGGSEHPPPPGCRLPCPPGSRAADTVVAAAEGHRAAGAGWQVW